VVATIEKLLQARAAANVERADSFGAVEFVRGSGKKIDAESFYVEGNFSGGLYSVGVEIDVALCGELSNFGERLHGAEFVVGVHDGDERGVRTKGFFDLVDGDDALGIYGEVGDGDAVFFKGLAGVEDGFVFDVGCDDVLGCAGSGTNDSEDGVIVGLGATAGEDDLLRAGAEKSSDLIAGGFDGGAGTLANGVNGGGVAEFGGEIGKHRVEDGGLDGGGGVEIEIDAVHGASSRVGPLAEGVNSARSQEGERHLPQRDRVHRERKEWIGDRSDGRGRIIGVHPAIVFARVRKAMKIMELEAFWRCLFVQRVCN